MVGDVFLSLCRFSNTSLARRAAQAWEDGDWAYLSNIPFDPFFYVWNERHEDFEVDYQIAAYFKAYQEFDLPVDREAAAFDKWLKAEEACRRTNSYFRLRWEGGNPPLPFHVEEILHLSRRKIREVLGTIKPADIAYVRDKCRHGPGSDLNLARKRASAYEKYRSKGSITEACSRAYDLIFGSADPDVRCDFAQDARLVCASELFTVPKTALIDRFACREPRWNVYLQLGIGELISQRLRRYGQDLQDQSRNQRAARRAWKDRLVTIDLSSASDTVATNLVVDLLAECDPLWLDLLLLTRCPYTEYKGKRFKLEKISSMGNGYTFPLESLIFYVFSWAACTVMRARPGNIQVYGDDIIVPAESSSALIEALTHVGFTVNTAKTYTSGVFFESCGEDYYRGENVRPMFIKTSPTDLAESYVLYNKIVRKAHIANGFYRQRWLQLGEQVIRHIPADLRLFGPTSVGGVLHAPFDRWDVLGKARGGVEGFYISALKYESPFHMGYSARGLLYWKLHLGTDFAKSKVVTPGKLDLCRTRTLVTFTSDFYVIEAP